MALELRVCYTLQMEIELSNGLRLIIDESDHKKVKVQVAGTTHVQLVKGAAAVG